MPSEETTLAVVEKTPAGKKPAQKRGRRGTFEASRTLESDFGMPEALELHVLHCLPGRITTFLKEGGYAERIGDKAPVNLSVVLQYVTKEALEGSVDYALESRNNLIQNEALPAWGEDG